MPVGPAARDALSGLPRSGCPAAVRHRRSRLRWSARLEARARGARSRRADEMDDALASPPARTRNADAAQDNPAEGSQGAPRYDTASTRTRASDEAPRRRTRGTDDDGGGAPDGSPAGVSRPERASSTGRDGPQDRCGACSGWIPAEPDFGWGRIGAHAATSILRYPPVYGAPASALASSASSPVALVEDPRAVAAARGALELENGVPDGAFVTRSHKRWARLAGTAATRFLSPHPACALVAPCIAAPAVTLHALRDGGARSAARGDGHAGLAAVGLEVRCRPALSSPLSCPAAGDGLPWCSWCTRASSRRGAAAALGGRRRSPTCHGGALRIGSRGGHRSWRLGVSARPRVRGRPPPRARPPRGPPWPRS